MTHFFQFWQAAQRANASIFDPPLPLSLWSLSPSDAARWKLSLGFPIEHWIEDRGFLGKVIWKLSGVPPICFQKSHDLFYGTEFPEGKVVSTLWHLFNDRTWGQLTPREYIFVNNVCQESVQQWVSSDPVSDMDTIKRYCHYVFEPFNYSIKWKEEFPL